MRDSTEEIRQIEHMINLVNRCMKLHLSNGNNHKAKLCIMDVWYLEKKLRQVKKRTKAKKVKIEVINHEANRSK